MIRSRDRHPYLTTHRLYWIRARLSYDPGGPVVASVTGPTTAGDQVTWTYSSGAGRAQTGYQVMLLAGAGADPDTAAIAADPFNPGAGEIIADSGRVNESLARAADLPGPVGGLHPHDRGARLGAHVLRSRGRVRLGEPTISLSPVRPRPRGPTRPTRTLTR